MQFFVLCNFLLCTFLLCNLIQILTNGSCFCLILRILGKYDIALSLNRFFSHITTASFRWCFSIKVSILSFILHIFLILFEVRDSFATSPLFQMRSHPYITSCSFIMEIHDIHLTMDWPHLLALVNLIHLQAYALPHEHNFIYNRWLLLISPFKSCQKTQSHHSFLQEILRVLLLISSQVLTMTLMQFMMWKWLFLNYEVRIFLQYS